MFGGKDDYDEYNERTSAAYDDDYIAPTEEYRADTFGSDSVSHEREDNALGEETSEYLRGAFAPYLREGERLLYTFGRDSRTDFGLNKQRRSMNKIIGLSILGMFIVCLLTFFIAFFTSGKASYIFIFLPFLLMPIAVLGRVTALIVWAVKLNNKADYAVTDRRILMLMSSYNNEMPYDNVTSVTCSVRRDGTGKVRIVSKTGNQISILTIPCVKEPEHLRAKIVEAVRNYQSSVH
jgi:hypothetical protein